MQDAELKLAKGKRYGLVGRNGAGKSTLLRALHSRSLVLPEGVSLLHVEQARDNYRSVLYSVGVSRRTLMKFCVS